MARSPFRVHDATQMGDGALASVIPVGALLLALRDQARRWGLAPNIDRSAAVRHGSPLVSPTLLVPAASRHAVGTRALAATAALRHRGD
jgi:hypothetical protein